MSQETKNIRNIIVLGHSGSGKTSMVESLLANGGTIPKAGSVPDGTTVCDYNEDEIERKITINSSITTVEQDGIKINFIDTPGYSDFIGEVHGALAAADYGIVMVNAVSGVEIGTGRFCKMLKKRGIPFALFINRMDKEHADFTKCFDQIQKKFGKNAVCVTYPIGAASSFKGVADLLSKTSMDSIEQSEQDIAKALSESMVESVAESDDSLVEKYLEQGELSADETESAFKSAVTKGDVIPVFAGSATADQGVKELLKVIKTAFPSPIDRPAVKGINLPSGDEIDIEPKTDGPLVVRVFKTISDPYLGHISVMKILSGSMTSHSSAFNVTKNVKEKIGQLLIMNGKKEKHIEKVNAGDICCCAKLKATETGDTLCDEKKQIKAAEMTFPEPAIAFSIKPKTRSDEDKISNALHKLIAEDNTFAINRDAQTRELIASGMGELHLNIMINRLRKRFGVQVDIGMPKVAYKETITSKGDSQYRHKKQSGGAGQFAEVWMRVEPLERSKGFEFVNEVVGGAIPSAFVASCEKGVKSSMDTGILAGFPVVDVKAIVYDGKTHPVDSKDIAFQIAARHCFKDACQKAKPVILEPVMEVYIVVPEEYMGDVTGSLNQRRGRVLGMDPGDGMQTVKAEVPLDEMYKYVNELKSITAGRATYTMKFSHYEVVPSNIATAIVAQKQKAKEEEHVH